MTFRPVARAADPEIGKAWLDHIRAQLRGEPSDPPARRQEALWADDGRPDERERRDLA